MKKNTEEENFAGVLVKAKDTGRVFLMLRSPSPNHGLTWGLISGGLDSGEDILEGLKREISEETQINPNIIKYNFIHSEEERGGLFYYYEGFTDSEFIPTLDYENLEYGWFEKDNLPSPLYPELHNKINLIWMKKKIIL